MKINEKKCKNNQKSIDAHNPSVLICPRLEALATLTKYTI